MLTAGDRIADRYVVESLAGRGGMAVVYRVQHAQLGSTHALKLLAMKTKGMTRRLEQEGRIQARLRHPNILQVTDLVEHDGQVGLVMEWVESPALDDWLASNGPLPVDAALSLFAQVLSAVAAAHDLGILHRDLKPANIMLAKGIGGYVPKVADFGIAKMVMDDAPSRTVGGMPMGTPGFMAPEQIRSAKDVDVRADVFSLGAVLYCMLTGKPPFEADEPFETMEATLTGKFAPLDGALPGCPARVVAAVHRSLDPDPDRRFRDVRAFGKELFADRPDLVTLFEPDAGGDELRIDRTGSISGASLSSGGMAGTRSAPGTVAMPTAIPPLTQPGATTTGAGRSRAFAVITVVGGLAAVGLVAVIAVGALLFYPRSSPELSPTPAPVSAEPPPRPVPEAAPALPPEPMQNPGPTAVEAPNPAPIGSPAPVASPRPSAPAPMPDPVAIVPEPTPAPAPEPIAAPEPVPEPVAAPAPTPAPVQAPPTLTGEWKGKANNQPMTLKFISQSGTQVEAAVTFINGPQTRTVRLHGRVMADGTLSLSGDDGGPLSFSGRVVDESASGKYSRNNGKMLDWNAAR